MKKQLMILAAAVALVGCERDNVNEPAGAETDTQMRDTTTNNMNTNNLSAPSDSSSGSSATQNP